MKIDFLDRAAKMFDTLKFYNNDPWASIYATQMHSDSGYLVTNGKSGTASYGGYLTWDDHPVSTKKLVKSNLVKTLQHCRPFGCVDNLD